MLCLTGFNMSLLPTRGILVFTTEQQNEDNDNNTGTASASAMAATATPSHKISPFLTKTLRLIYPMHHFDVSTRKW
jgi:hypothetical protein